MSKEVGILTRHFLPSYTSDLPYDFRSKSQAMPYGGTIQMKSAQRRWKTVKLSLSAVALAGIHLRWLCTRRGAVNAPLGEKDAPQKRRDYSVGQYRGWPFKIDQIMVATPIDGASRNDIVDRRWRAGA